MERIKLIWDFRGQDAWSTALHHKKHLLEYIAMEKLENADADAKQLSDYHSTAYIVIPREKMIEVRDRLLPHRGELA
ncbi:MAG: hypothetical protein Q4B43_02090 [Bacteroidota bacterium]|nr:hypothetical protein [Bacteroidota bacterium]